MTYTFTRYQVVFNVNKSSDKGYTTRFQEGFKNSVTNIPLATNQGFYPEYKKSNLLYYHTTTSVFIAIGSKLDVIQLSALDMKYHLTAM